MERINILENLRKSKKYDIALLTTFNLELSFFERSILNKLYDNGTRKISIFADSKEYIKALNEIEFSYIGNRYVVTPVEMNSSFHPKVILLLGKDKARLFVGSCNLTTSGYYINNEISNMIDYDIDHPNNLSLIQDAMSFFLELNERTDKRDNELIQKIKLLPYYRVETNDNSDRKFIHNINKSILEQSRELINGKVNKIDIAVPYYDPEVLALKEIQELYPDSKIKLYIQNERNTFPEKYKEQFEINLYNKFNDNESYHFYHGKVFRFITDNDSYVLYGSANCTNAAFTKATISGGNVECDLFARGKIDEYDYFFDNFFIEEGIEFKSDILNVDKYEKNNYLFNDNITNTLYFKFKNKYDDLKIYISDQEIKYETNENEIRIIVPIEILDKLSSIFVVKFIYQDKEENVSCYFNDREQIERNRNQELLNRIPDINVSPDINAEPDMYLKDRIDLITKFGFMYDIFNEKLDYYIKDTESADSEMTDEMEDFIDYDYKLSDEVQVKVKTLNQILKANNHIFYSFREHMLTFKTGGNSVSNNISERINENVIVQKSSRSATSDEKSFARMVNNIAKDMINKTNSNKLDFSNYIQCVVSLFETYNKFMIRENVLDMFEESKVIDIQYNLIKELTSKLNNEITVEEKEMYLWLAFASILQINYINTTGDKVDYKKNLSNRDLLKQIDERFNIRESYNEYLEVSIRFINQLEERIDKTISKAYIESLFEHRTESQINSLMDKNFGNDYSIDNASGVVTININTDKIGDYFKLNDPVIKEIIKTYSVDENFKMLHIIAINKNINPDFPDPPIKIEYMLNRSGNGQQITTPKISNPRIREYSVK